MFSIVLVLIWKRVGWSCTKFQIVHEDKILFLMCLGSRGQTVREQRPWMPGVYQQVKKANDSKLHSDSQRHSLVVG